MKKNDFTINRGIEKLDFQRGVTINEKSSNIHVVLEINWKKGVFKIRTLWNNDQVTHNDQEDKSFLQTLGELQLAARDYAAKWQKEWQKENPSDPEQITMGFGDIDGEAVEG